MQKRQKLTKTVVDKATVPVDKDQVFIRDTELKGFALRITRSGSKAFVVEKRVEGKNRRSTLGVYPQITVEQARRKAMESLGKMSFGVDITEEKRADRSRAEQERITVIEVFEQYLQARKSLKPNTIKDYTRHLNETLGCWKYKPMVSINREMVMKLHKKRGNESITRANGAMRVLRALFNFAMEYYEKGDGSSLFRENPVMVLSRTKAWYPQKRRRTLIPPHKLKHWFDAVNSLQDEKHNSQSGLIRDYLLFLLFTGLRRSEAAQLKKEDIDLYGMQFTIPDTKNGEPHVLPITDFLFEILQRRIAESPNEFVFYGTGKAGYLVEPRKQMNHVIERSGVEFTLHDLRRTFATIAEAQDIPAYALKRLLNHKMNNDITVSYIIHDVNRLRAPMEKVSQFILRAVDAPIPQNVVSMMDYQQA